MKKSANLLLPLAFYLLPVLVFCSCSGKKEKVSNTVVATVDTTTVNTNDTVAMEQKTVHQQAKWGDSSYSVDIERKADRSLSVVSDQQGRHYYDNQVNIIIDSAEGQVLNRTFHKSDFEKYVNPQYVNPKHSVLSTIAFKDVSGNILKLVASVGSPDETDDNYMLVEVSVDKHGNCTMRSIDENEE